MLAAGGRYDEMVGTISRGHEVPCVGFTVHIEEIFKLLSEREQSNLDSIHTVQTMVLVASDQGYVTESMKVCTQLWKSKIKVKINNNNWHALIKLKLFTCII